MYLMRFLISLSMKLVLWVDMDVELDTLYGLINIISLSSTLPSSLFTSLSMYSS